MRRLEDQLQRAVVELLTIYERQGKLRFFAVPNGGKRSKIEAAIMKGLGVRAGVPDLCVLIAHGPTVFIELKAPNGSAKPSQIDWALWLKKNGHGCEFYHSLDEVKELIEFALRDRRAA